MTSLTIEWLKLPLLADTWHSEATILVLGNITGIYELLEE